MEELMVHGGEIRGHGDSPAGFGQGVADPTVLRRFFYYNAMPPNCEGRCHSNGEEVLASVKGSP